nr:uncharacterized protein LOC109152979 [Ipomoea batatas]
MKGLKIAWERGFRKVMVETDANNIVEALNMPNSNRVADVLAKWALSYDRGLLIFHQPVPEVVLSLEEDVLGFPQGRLVSNMS